MEEVGSETLLKNSNTKGTKGNPTEALRELLCYMEESKRMIREEAREEVIEETPESTRDDC